MPSALSPTPVQAAPPSVRAESGPVVPIVMVTPERKTARQHTIVWGLHCVVVENMETLDQVAEAAQEIGLQQGFGVEGDQVVLTAGVPFGQVGQTNLLRLLRL